MRTKKYITLILLLLGVVAAHSQERRKEIRIDFRVNVTTIDSTYSDNAANLKDIINYLQFINSDSTITILEVSFCGAASPEGSDQLNRKLALGRLTSLEKVVRQEVEIPDSIISRNDSYIPWDYLKELIEVRNMPYKNEILEILNEDGQLVDYHHPNTHIDDRIVKLKKLDNGRVWQQMHKLFFEDMRNASVVFITYKKDVPPVQKPVIVAPDTVVPQQEPVDTTKVVEAEEYTSNLRMHVKTNAIGLGFGITNAGVEIDFAEHWSFGISAYYSGWNYFKNSVKFRVNSFYPEVRYWFSPFNTGFFVGAHAGIANFNYAFDEIYRYQDHDTETPAIGGGLGIGYRLPLSKNRKWNMEFAVGAGVYDIKYDRFYNVPNGRLVDTHRKTYFCIDQAALSLSYAFDIKKKGGKR